MIGGHTLSYIPRFFSLTLALLQENLVIMMHNQSEGDFDVEEPAALLDTLEVIQSTVNATERRML